MNAKEVLTEAARLLRDVGWTQRAWARDDKGESVWPGNPKAVCYCMMGAIQEACGVHENAESVAISRLSLSLEESPNIAAFNDTPGRTKEECIAKLLEAAEL